MQFVKLDSLPSVMTKMELRMHDSLLKFGAKHNRSRVTKKWLIARAKTTNTILVGRLFRNAMAGTHRIEFEYLHVPKGA